MLQCTRNAILYIKEEALMGKSYTPSTIKNMVLLGHQGVGKTSLIESLLFATKKIAKKGHITEGSTVSDYTKEEKKK